MSLKSASKQYLAVALSAVFVAACGGGGGGGGSPGLPLPPPVNPGEIKPTASDLTVTLDKATLSNSGSDSAVLTVTAVDASRNAVGGAPISIAVDGNAIFSSTGDGKTASDGTYKGTITIGADKSNRLIKYTVTSGSVVKTGAISVTGAVVSAASVPALPTPGQKVTFSVKVKDKAGAPVVGAMVAASGIPGFTFPAVTTNNDGEVTFSFSAPSAEGIYPISIQSSGVSTSYDLRVLSTGSGTVQPAVGPVSGASAIATPVVVAANSAGGNGNRSEVKAIFVGANNRPIPNMRVRFSIVSTSLPGESLTDLGTTVYSDMAGEAKTSYIAATTNSPNEGVKVQACYDVNDFDASVCPNRLTTNLTVTSNPVNLTIGVGNEIERTPSKISYIKKFEIQAVNSAGNYAVDVPLSAVVHVEGYWKGAPVPNPPTLETNDFAGYKWCLNEDTNRNGVLDAGEDTNQDGSLTPRQSDVAIGFPGSNKTDANGLATIQLQYPQNLATWLRVMIRVNAGVSGSEGSATYRFILKPEKKDFEDGTGSFFTPPYGSSGSCSNAQ